MASGTGQHVSYFAANLEKITWQPSDYCKDLFDSITAYGTACGLGDDRIRAPILLDMTDEKWCDAAVDANQGQKYDMVYVANITHISPYNVTEGLLAGAGSVLKKGGRLFIYGPFIVDGQATDSNWRFSNSVVMTIFRNVRRTF